MNSAKQRLHKEAGEGKGHQERLSNQTACQSVSSPASPQLGGFPEPREPSYL